jgi:hypothetical protein
MQRGWHLRIGLVTSVVLRALYDVLEGVTPYERADPAIQSWATYYFYEAAEEILALPTVKERRTTLQGIPLAVRPYIESEVRRLWQFYRSETA